MEKGQGKGTDTLPTDNVFTREEYIEREAVLHWIDFASDGYAYLDTAVESARHDIKAIPAADVVSVVRCGECEFWERDRITCEGVARCKTGESGVRFRARNDYCSRAILKRKDGDEE